MTSLQTNNNMKKEDLFQTFLTSPSLERVGTITFEISPAFHLTHSIVEARVWVAFALKKKKKTKVKTEM